MKYSEWDSVVEYLANNLTQEIKEREYTVGDRFLTEKEICERFSVGRSSAREALRILEATGWVEIIRGRGAFIAKNNEDNIIHVQDWYASNADELHQLIEARLLIEPPVVARVARKITPAQLEEMQRIHDAFGKAVDEHNVLSAVALDEKFHIKLVDLDGNSYISKINKDIQKASSVYRAKTYDLPKYFDLSHPGHASLMNCLRGKDSEGAAEVVDSHIRGALGYFSEISAKVEPSVQKNGF